MKKSHKIWSCNSGSQNTSVHDLTLMNKLSRDTVKFLGTEIKWWQLPPTTTCLVLCRDESFWDRSGQPGLACANPNSAFYLVLHMTRVTETHASTSVSTGYRRECLWAQDLRAQASASSHRAISFSFFYHLWERKSNLQSNTLIALWFEFA